jgi:hypothetical protein
MAGHFRQLAYLLVSARIYLGCTRGHRAARYRAGARHGRRPDLVRARPRLYRSQMAAPGPDLPPVGRGVADHHHGRAGPRPARRPRPRAAAPVLFVWAFNPGTRNFTPPDEVISALDWIAAASLLATALEEAATIRRALASGNRRDQDHAPWTTRGSKPCRRCSVGHIAAISACLAQSCRENAALRNSASADAPEQPASSECPQPA